MLFVATGAGGAFGAIVRFALQTSLNTGGFPLGTFLCNILGCYCAGFLLARDALIQDMLRAFLVGGALGSLTTLSSFAAEAFRMLYSQTWWPGALYVFVTVAGSLSACVLGWMSGAIR